MEELGVNALLCLATGGTATTTTTTTGAANPTMGEDTEFVEETTIHTTLEVPAC